MIAEVHSPSLGSLYLGPFLPPSCYPLILPVSQEFQGGAVKLMTGLPAGSSFRGAAWLLGHPAGNQALPAFWATQPFLIVAVCFHLLLLFSGFSLTLMFFPLLHNKPFWSLWKANPCHSSKSSLYDMFLYQPDKGAIWSGGMVCDCKKFSSSVATIVPQAAPWPHSVPGKTPWEWPLFMESHQSPAALQEHAQFLAVSPIAARSHPLTLSSALGFQPHSCYHGRELRGLEI